MSIDPFRFPIDNNILIRKSKIRKELLSSNTSLVSKRIAVLGGSTTNEVVDQ